MFKYSHTVVTINNILQLPYLPIRASPDVQKAAWESCWISARGRVKDRSGWLSDDKAEGFSNWKQEGTDAQLLFMATYTPDCTSVNVTPQIMDGWRTAAVRAMPVKLVDSDGYQTVSRKKQTEAAEVYDVIGRDENFSPDDGQFDQIFGNDDAINEALRRFLDIPDDDSFDDEDDNQDEFESNRRLSDEEVQVKLTVRKIPKITTCLYDQVREGNSSRDFRSLSMKEKIAMSTCWAQVLKMDADSSVLRYTEKYKEAADLNSQYEARVDTVILRSAAAIGMTTNGAAKYNRYSCVFFSHFNYFGIQMQSFYYCHFKNDYFN